MQYKLAQGLLSYYVSYTIVFPPKAALEAGSASGDVIAFGEGTPVPRHCPDNPIFFILPSSQAHCDKPGCDLTTWLQTLARCRRPPTTTRHGVEYSQYSLARWLNHLQRLCSLHHLDRRPPNSPALSSPPNDTRVLPRSSLLRAMATIDSCAPCSNRPCIQRKNGR